MIAVSGVVLAEGILVWQFFQLAKKEVPALKEATEQQAVQAEQHAAEYVFDKFMENRIARQKEQALIYLTENAMEQYSQGKFDLVNDFKSFEIIKSEKLSDFAFRFIVKIREENEVGELVEAVTLFKILDRYYVDSVEIAG